MLATKLGLVLVFPDDLILADVLPDLVRHRELMSPTEDRFRLFASKGELASKSPELSLLASDILFMTSVSSIFSFSKSWSFSCFLLSFVSSLKTDSGPLF